MDGERVASDRWIATRPTEFVDIVVGGQAGSEGKGAVVAHLTRSQSYGGAVRPGSSNAGHTVYDEDCTEHIQQVIPSPGVIDPDIDLYMAAESSFGLDELAEERARIEDVWGESLADRLYIDPKAAVIDERHREIEAERQLGEEIGSTVHGVGAVRADKIWRSAGNVSLAEEHDELSAFVGPRTVERLVQHGRSGEPVIIEGTQGTMLSMNHSHHYPFTTSRDCLASSFLSSCGLPPSTTREVWAVFRTYPIRVGGNSGSLSGEEISFETIAERAGFEEPPVEFTSVTKKKRRIFEWSWRQFEYSLQMNGPDKIAITFMDYLDADNYGATTLDELVDESLDWVYELREALSNVDAQLGLLKTGPLPEHTIDLREEGFHDTLWEEGFHGT